MTKQSSPKNYRDEVMTWGNQAPWKKLGIRVSHRVTFPASAVKRDGQGNILSMPLLPRKPCFGRPEAFFRHGRRVIQVRLPGGRSVDSSKHQCGSCPKGVWQACAETSWERVQSDPAILKAFREWRSFCQANFNGELRYTGPASLLWGAFKEAIASRGPFLSSNDEELERQRVLEQAEKRRKWVEIKRRQREAMRAQARLAKQLPDKQFVSNLISERDRRRDTLLRVLGRSDQPPSRSKVPADKRMATATITANAWAISKLLWASGEDPRPARIARLMVERGLSAGTTYPTLKARIANDLRRARECERDGLWGTFDPDRDLEHSDGSNDNFEDCLGDHRAM